MNISTNIEINIDNIIIGGGGAGLTAAINLAKNNKSVAIISKIPPLLSHTSAAQGGINANFGNIEEDDWRWHMYDTIKGSDWLADQDSVEILCSKANEAVSFLHSIGVPFDLDEKGKIFQKKYGGQTTNFGKGKLAHRACCVKDRTGDSIMNKLYYKALELGVTFYNYYLAIELIIDNGLCLGVICLDIANAKIVTFYSNNTIIATGGYSQIFESNTASNSLTGDGLYLCAKAGFALKDMEFVQFHPTSMAENSILISETARAIGGYLLNQKGERFMSKYAPKYLELAPRDIVSRAITHEITKEGSDFVYIDMRHIDEKEVLKKLPYIARICNIFLKIDYKKDLIPTLPSAHYTMGGIPTNKYGLVLVEEPTTSEAIDNLYAIGECACHSVHGSNRLGCNSLLDIIVFGFEASSHIINTKKPYQIKNSHTLSKINLNSPIDLNEIKKLKNKLKNSNTNNLGIIRTRDSIIKSIQELDQIEKDTNRLDMKNIIETWDINFIEFFELKSLIESSKHLAYSALSREESRGSHYRSDFPERNDTIFWKHSYSVKQNNKISTFYKNVRITTNNVSFFQLEERNY